LIAVSKTYPASDLQFAYLAGQRHFGENKVQEITEKQAVLAKDIQWHFIGHLQSNKVKFIAPFISLIHSVDSFKLLQEINKQGIKNDRIIDCLLQFHIASEETKFGLSLNEARELLESEAFSLFQNIRITGIMGMASFTEDLEKVRGEFKQLFQIFQILKNTYFSENSTFKEISMGMSGDFEIAVEEGSTLVRVGSSIFGSR
jgi:pyridoxal phosphate enzyme (YggS family)